MENQKNTSKGIKTLCFMLNCTETVIRKPDDFINVYCDYHKEYNETTLDNYLPKIKK